MYKKNLFVVMVLVVTLIVLIAGCATTKKSGGVLSGDLEIVIIEPSGNSTTFYVAKYDTVRESGNKWTTFYFFEEKGKITAKKTLVPGTRVLFNDYSKSKENPKSWSRDWIK